MLEHLMSIPSIRCPTSASTQRRPAWRWQDGLCWFDGLNAVASPAAQSPAG
jgi:hypothetical protein